MTVSKKLLTQVFWVKLKKWKKYTIVKFSSIFLIFLVSPKKWFINYFQTFTSLEYIHKTWKKVIFRGCALNKPSIWPLKGQILKFSLFDYISPFKAHMVPVVRKQPLEFTFCKSCVYTQNLCRLKKYDSVLFLYNFTNNMIIIKMD